MFKEGEGRAGSSIFYHNIGSNDRCTFASLANSTTYDVLLNQIQVGVSGIQGPFHHGCSGCICTR